MVMVIRVKIGVFERALLAGLGAGLTAALMVVPFGLL
jgi:hypothetical protein